jgi:hypothetical protein
MRRVVRFDQRGAQAGLHLRQVLADGGRRHAEFARRGAEAAGARQRREEGQVGRVDGVRHRRSIVESRLTMDSL